MKKVFFLNLFLLSLIFYVACEQEQYDCAGFVNLGNIDLADSSKAFINPYQGKKKAFFKDSLGKVVEFSLTLNAFRSARDLPVPKAHCPDDRYLSNLEILALTMKSIELDKEIFLELSIYQPGPDRSKEKADRLTCGMNYIIKPNLVSEIFFYDLVFSNSSYSEKVVFKKVNVDLLGKTFNNLFVDKDNIPIKCYLDKIVGIRAFRDFDNKLWVFDRFE